jgi:hypothetical protein
MRYGKDPKISPVAGAILRSPLFSISTKDQLLTWF